MLTVLTEAKYKEIINGLRLIDDVFMSVVFKNKKCTELMLRIILDNDTLVVKNVATQQEISNIRGRSVKLDILAVDADDKLYNIEFQRVSRGASPKRARYHSAILDTNNIDKKDAHEKLPETYVIFLTEKDVFKDGLAIHHVDRIVTETGKYFEDGTHIIYVNGNYRGDDELGLLIKDLFISDPNEMHFDELAKETNYYKNSEGGEGTMCEAIKNMVAEYEDELFKKGHAEGVAETKVQTYAMAVKSCIKNFAVSFEEAAKKMEVPTDLLEKVKEIIDADN